MKRLIEANANTGLGVGFRIEYVLERCQELRIT
jgi:hypothetical protein